jgi:glycine/D-amino acid oxidase-like deaminating enzyme
VREHNLEYEDLTSEQVAARFPGYHVPAHFKVGQLVTMLSHSVGGDKESAGAGDGKDARDHPRALPGSHLLARRWLRQLLNFIGPATDPPTTGRHMMSLLLVLVQALFQPQGGILKPEKCIEAHVAAAKKHGAEVHEGMRQSDCHPRCALLSRCWCLSR